MNPIGFRKSILCTTSAVFCRRYLKLGWGDEEIVVSSEFRIAFCAPLVDTLLQAAERTRLAPGGEGVAKILEDLAVKVPQANGNEAKERKAYREALNKEFEEKCRALVP